MKITIITQNLCGGGVQKSVLALSKALKTKHKVSFLLFEQKELFFDVSDIGEISYLPQFDIDISSDDVGFTLYRDRVLAVENFFESDDSGLYIVFEDYNALVALEANRFDKKIIVSSRVGFKIYEGRKIHLLPQEFYMEAMTRLYPNACGVIAVSDGVKSDLGGLGIEAKSIYNGIDIEQITEMSQEPCEYENFILHIGRMDFAQKGQDDALEAFGKISTKTDANLVFIGDGKDFGTLRLMTDKMGLSSRVFFVGLDKNPYRFLRKCRLLVFSSYYEGMPNVLLEAMALGVSIVSYDFLPSADEFLHGKIPFLLTERGNTQKLSKAILELLLNEQVASKIANDALNVARLYDREQNAKQWLCYIDDIEKDRINS
ncbi:MAG: glycosyltransferase [Campylobacterales bacterium]|nr:glycosyltransferase [Campylobacterales bacterium]